MNEKLNIRITAGNKIIEYSDVDYKVTDDRSIIVLRGEWIVSDPNDQKVVAIFAPGKWDFIENVNLICA